MNKPEKKYILKDMLFNKDKVEYLRGLIFKAYPALLVDDFQKEVLDKFPELELKQRISHITSMLKKYLPNDYKKAVNIILESLPEHSHNGTLDNNFGDFIFVPYCDFVAQYGCEKGFLDFSYDALEKITPYASAEDAIRYFFNKYEEETFDKMLERSKSDSYFVRRLASEGSRPKLPWCQKIKLDYKLPIQILNNLYYDESRYVTRSVANHLNDISKIDSELVVKTLQRWKKDKKAGDIDYIISHSTRTLVKSGDQDTLELLGYTKDPKIELTNFELNEKNIKIGESLLFEFDIKSGKEKKQKLVIDYRIYFIGKNGKLLPKVFKLSKLDISSKDKIVNISKKHPLRIMSTKTLYPGEHYVEIIINGKVILKRSFNLT